ncbi:MAG: tripartite tricarboxylate transporter permease [Planctomycetes bacterium]|nr:tripartite tricarboxylate transporter permease [Planctomycetota bacterium]
MEIIGLLGAIVVGTLIASVMACLPALHIYNVAGFALLFALPVIREGLISSSILIAFMMSLIVAYSILNTIPSIFLGAPDESAIFVTMPGTRALMQGRGFETAMLTAVGSLGGIAFLLLASFIFPYFLPALRTIVSPYMHWVLGCILAFMIMAEWPKGENREKTRWLRFFNGWKNLWAGLLTLLLSGILGFIVMYKPMMPIEISFQNIMPTFVGLFAIPWVLQNIISKTEPPKQHIAESLDVTPRVFLRGAGAGCLGGIFAAIFPIVTGGIGGMLAGHATAQRDERMFIVSQGASKVVYYVGGFLLLFVPGASFTRGGMAYMLQGVYTSHGHSDYYIALAVIGISGAISFFTMLYGTKAVIWLIGKINYRFISIFTFIFITSVVYYMGGFPGIAVMLVSTGIGMIPVFFHSRRMNCMGVLLIPVMLNMSGHGPIIAHWMGLL